MNAHTNGAEPHFRTGVAGWLARFFIARRAAGDPFDATLVLPCIIFLVLVRLNDLGRVDARAVIAGLVIPASIAGCWIGAALGTRGQGRAMLRAVLVGGIEGAAYLPLVNEVLDKNTALTTAVNLIYVNLVIFWFFSLIASGMSEVLVQSEHQWQIVVARRARIRRSMQGVFGVSIIIYRYFANYIANDLPRAVLNALVAVFVVYQLPKLGALIFAFVKNYFPF